MIFVVGDIHGEITKLKKLVEAILIKDSHPEFVFIGDYIDKGEDAFSTLKFLTDLKTNYDCTFLMGNHEYLWLKLGTDDSETKEYLLKYGAKKTISSLGVNDIFDAKKKLLNSFTDFFSVLQPFWKNQDYVAVHSGIKPEDYHKPIESIDVLDLIFNRYDFIKQEKNYFEKYKVIFGHTGFYSPFVDDFKIGIDTSACYLREQPLTSFSPDSNLFIDSYNQNYSLESIGRNYCPNIPRIKL